MKGYGLIHIYTGRGKGKTAIAVGLALRAYGAKKRICFIQFLKARLSSEIVGLRKLKIRAVLFKEKHPLFYKSASIQGLRKRIAQDLEKTKLILKDRRYNFIVLDEILYLLERGWVKEEDVLDIIKKKPKQTELILTGGSATKKIIKLADYASRIKNVKHPFDAGVAARRGIEF